MDTMARRGERGGMSEGGATATTLILVRDVLGAGLLGILAELEGTSATFPLDGERGDAAVRRLCPSVVLVDGSHAAARSAAFYDAAHDHGCRVVLFAATTPWGDVVDSTRDRPEVTLIVPRAGQSLAAAVQAALRDDA